MTRSHTFDRFVRSYFSIYSCSVSKPEQIIYNATGVNNIESEEDIGPEVIHLYEVRLTRGLLINKEMHTGSSFMRTFVSLSFKYDNDCPYYNMGYQKSCSRLGSRN